MRQLTVYSLGILALVIFLIACGKINRSPDFDMSAELSTGGWLFLSVEDSLGNTVLDGSGFPQMILFFNEGGEVKGRLKGDWNLNEKGFHFRAEIDTLQPIFGFEYDVLANFPQRYYDLETITKSGIQGEVDFRPDPLDAIFYLHYEDNRVMSFQRH